MFEQELSLPRGGSLNIAKLRLLRDSGLNEDQGGILMIGKGVYTWDGKD
jgi:hypothetical protein